MKPIKKTLTALALLATSVGLVTLNTACTKKDPDGNLAVYHGAIADDIKTLDPANAYDSISLDFMPSIYEQLYQYAYLSDTYTVIPLLAADMPKFSADRLTITIPLRQGILFADDKAFKATNGKGRELTAQDFIYGWKRLALPSLQSQGWWIFDGKIAGINAYHEKLVKAAKADIPKLFDEEIEGLKALDKYTIQIKLVKPYPQLMYILAMGFTSPVAREAVEAYGDENGNLTDHPVGTGPFILAKWDRGRKVVLEKNPNYHPDFYPADGAAEFRQKGLLADAGKKLPFLDRVDVDVVREQQPRWLNFMKNKLDLTGIPKDNFQEAIVNKVNLAPALASRGMRLSIDYGTRIWYIAFNFKDKVVGENKYLRQALSSAIDREKWIQIFTNGTGIKMVTALPPGIQDRPKDPQLKYDFNLERAKELLKKAGYPEGKGLPVINFDLRGADSVNRQLGEYFQQQFGQIGVKVNVIYNTFPAFLEKAKQGNLQMFYGGWQMDYPDAENVYQLLYGPNKAPGPNDTNFINPTMDKLYDQIAVMESGPTRAALIKQMDDLLQEEVPWALGYYQTQYALSHPWLENYRADEIITNKLKYYRIDKEVKKRYLENAK